MTRNQSAAVTAFWIGFVSMTFAAVLFEFFF